MDREISKEVQRKEQRKQFIRIGTAVGGFIVLIVVVISMLQTSLKRKDLNISTVDKGVIEVSYPHYLYGCQRNGGSIGIDG